MGNILKFMYELIYSKWQGILSKSPYPDSLPLTQKKELVIRLLDTIFKKPEEIYYLIPEIINFAESNNLKYKEFINSFFLLRDAIISLPKQDFKPKSDIQTALSTLEDVILKIGAYFSNLSVDLNITQFNPANIDIDRFEWNILQMDENFLIEKSNSSILKYFNYEKKEIIGKPIQFLFTESSRNIISNAITQLKQKEKYKLDLEVEAQKKNGQAFQAFLNITHKNTDDSCPKYTAYIKNNSYFYETKAMLSLLSMALESVAQGIVILEPKSTGTILYVNEAMEKMSGFTRDYLLGKPFSCLRNSKELTNLEGEIIKSTLKEGWEGEITNIRKDNRPYLVNLLTQPIVGDYGRTVAIVGIEQDITDQRNHENQIIHLKQFVERIINKLQHFVVVTDANLNIKFWNKSLEHRLPPKKSDAYGKNIFKIIPQLNQPQLELAAKNVLLTGKLFTKKILTEFGTEGEKYLQLYLTNISTDQEKQLLWTLLDITQEEMLKVKITWQNARLKFLENFSQILNSNLDLKKLLEKFTQELRIIIPFNTLSFYLTYRIEEMLFNLYFFSKNGTDSFPQSQILDFSKEKVYREIVNSRVPAIYNFFTPREKASQPKSEPEYEENINQIIRLPICVEKEVLGILNIGHKEANYFNQNDLDFLQQIANHLVIALRNSFYLQLVKLQNQKLFIINSIFNFEPSFKSFPNIFNVAISGLAELLESDLAAFYSSNDGKNWEIINEFGTTKEFPKNFILPTSSLKENTITWDKYSQTPFQISEFPNLIKYSSGLFSWGRSTTQDYLSFWAFNNQTMDHLKHNVVIDLIQDILKQMTISIDNIDLFEKVKLAETEWETTFDAVNMGLVIVDKNFKILRANIAFSRLFHLKPEQYLNKTCKEVFCFLPADDQCSMFQNNSTKYPLAVNHEYLNSRINKRISQKFFPIMESQTLNKGGVFVIQDVTAQREQESKIKFLSKFPETNPNIVISTNNTGELKYVNPAAQKILEEFNNSEKNLKELLPGNLKMILKQIQQEEKSYIEIEQKFKDRVFQYFIYFSPEEEQLYFYGTDITEKLEMQRHFLQTENIRAVGEMASGVAHDFNNLLATILGRTQLLLLKTQNEEIKEELQVIEKAAIDGGKIVKRIQEVTRERRDKNYQVVNISDIIKESIIFSANRLKLSTQLKGKEIKIHTDINEVSLVKGNSVELKEIFTNLLLNAYDAMSGGGELFIECKNLNNITAQIKIQDTGIGMPEEIKNKIFNPFFTTKGEKGTGLGLSIVYQTITSHGGHIEVESEPNQGTLFTITLPVTDEALKNNHKKVDKVQEGNGNIRLLIVDDEPELLDTMAEILRLKFTSVEIANSGNNAINKLKQQSYDIVLTDLGMPEMSGWELAKQIKQIRPDSKVILVTGWGDQARQELKHHPYVDEILPKPYELQHLIQKINKFSIPK